MTYVSYTKTELTCEDENAHTEKQMFRMSRMVKVGSSGWLKGDRLQNREGRFLGVSHAC